MVHFFIEGGFVMYPILILGLILTFASLRYAIDGESVRLRLIVVLALALTINSFCGMMTDVAQVLWYLTDPTRAPDGQIVRLLVTGLKESSRPGIMGFGFLSLASIVTAIGIHRTGQRELRAARG